VQATVTPSPPSATQQVTPTDRFEPLTTPADSGRPAPNLPGGLEQVSTSEAPITGEAPAELLEKITADLTGRLGAGSQEIRVVQAEAVVWNDGSLGCPKPGQAYTQAQVEGYHIILEIAGREYDYRASQQGFFFLCRPAI
jgi:hypothetical protein